MTEPHLDPSDLRRKINSLFDYRMFPWLLDQCPFKAAEEKEDFLNQLTDLQTHIYELDAHLEGNWKTNEQILNRHWDILKQDLCHFGIAANKANIYLSHIKKYEIHELALRSGRMPKTYGIFTFYFYKSCDVKLLRRLIYEKGDLRSQLGSLDEWRYFDLVTEVNDDVVDLQEDLHFVNGNGFLITLISEDITATREKFLKFLEEIAQRAKRRYKLGPRSAFREMVLQKTLQQVEATKELVEKQLQTPLLEIKESAKLYRYINPEDPTTALQSFVSNK